MDGRIDAARANRKRLEKAEGNKVCHLANIWPRSHKGDQLTAHTYMMYDVTSLGNTCRGGAEWKPQSIERRFPWKTGSIRYCATYRAGSVKAFRASSGTW